MIELDVAKTYAASRVEWPLAMSAWERMVVAEEVRVATREASLGARVERIVFDDESRHVMVVWREGRQERVLFSFDLAA